VVKPVEPDARLREREEEHEDLHEDRRVADDLDVDGGDLADDRDAVGAGGAERQADRERAGDREGGDLDRVDEGVEQLAPVLGHERPEVVGGNRHG
jgi:hypothetical protein